MPHSNFRMRFQMFEFSSGRERNMKLQMHLKFCSKPPECFRYIKKPSKDMTLTEQQLHKAERKRMVHENH